MVIPRWLRRLFRSPYDGLRNFRVVEPGVLYRCGQPRPAELASLIREHGLRTVISLRGRRDEGDPDDWIEAQAEVCRGSGVSLVHIPFNHKNPPTAQQLGQFLEIVRDPSRVPALVHCRAGQQRTGLFVALFRVHAQGMAVEEALREMDALGFNSRHRRHQRLLRAYRELASEPPPHGAQPPSAVTQPPDPAAQPPSTVAH